MTVEELIGNNLISLPSLATLRLNYWMEEMSRKNIESLDKDFLDLARIALTGRTQDIQMLLHKIAKRHSEANPALNQGIGELLNQAPTRSSPLRRQTEIPLPVDVDTRLQLLKVESEPSVSHEPVFAAHVQKVLEQIVYERSRPEALFAADLEPTKTAIFTGPPGVGKTMAARWLAREVGRPLLILDLAAVMSSYLGRTGTNLRHVLDYAKSIECVLLLDELDAIAKRRDDSGEIGELKRLVTVLIQEIDDWPATGILLAATNHSELLDPAIWRRFEWSIDFPLPVEDEITRFVMPILKSGLDNNSEWAAIISVALKGESFSDIERKIKSARRASILKGSPLEDCLIEMLAIESLPKEKKIQLAADLSKHKIISQRKAQELTGVARETIRNHSKKAS